MVVLRFGLLLAAVGHDLGHPGVNNPFLVEPGSCGPPHLSHPASFACHDLRTRHELAVTYNDRSPLENMHCSKLFQILREPETNVFLALDKAESALRC